jgi:hypothetical protein
VCVVSILDLPIGSCLFSLFITDQDLHIGTCMFDPVLDVQIGSRLSVCLFGILQELNNGK